MAFHNKREDDQFSISSQFSNEESCNYKVITFMERIKLIELVCIEGVFIGKAAALMGINKSTAKHIIGSYKKKGKILRKSQDQKIEDQKVVDIILSLQVRQSQFMAQKIGKKDKIVGKLTESTPQENTLGQQLKVKEECEPVFYLPVCNYQNWLIPIFFVIVDR